MRTKIKTTEAQFQIAVAAYLEVALKKGVLWTAFPAGGGGYRRGALLKRMGLKPGWPDLLFLHRGKLFGIELKTPIGKVSPAQRALHKALQAQGVPVLVVKTSAEVSDALDQWGLLSLPK